MQQFSSSHTPHRSKIEQWMNALPHPFFGFLILCLLVAVCSLIGSFFPNASNEIIIKNLISAEGLEFILSTFVTNFTHFPALGVILCMMLSLGLAEKTGLARASIIFLFSKIPDRFLIAGVFFIGILGNITSEASLILIPPLAGLLFFHAKKHPVVGIVVGFVAVTAGFTANLVIANTDILLSTITTSAIQHWNLPTQTVVHPTANWFFMALSVPLLVVLGTWITYRFTIPHLAHIGYSCNEPTHTFQLTTAERKALGYTGYCALSYIALWIVLLLPSVGVLRDANTQVLLNPLFFKSLIPILMGFFLVCAITYGRFTGAIAEWKNLPTLLAQAINQLGGFILLMLVIAQFIAWLEWSQLAKVGVSWGAMWIEQWPLPASVLLLVFMVFAAFASLFINSGSALWALLAPVFVPFFAVLGIEPAITQLAYRIADSSTNILSITNPYLGITLALVAQYTKEMPLGAFLRVMIPYTVVFFGVWTAFFIGYIALGLPVGF